jgi:hypothetical protein
MRLNPSVAFMIAAIALASAYGVAAAAGAPRSRHAGDKKAEYREFVAESKAKLVADFKDPVSAQFRGLFVSSDGKMEWLCGEVNGKNSYGAYVGFRQFFASGTYGPAAIVEPGTSVYELRRQWVQERCGNKIADVP